MQHRLKFAHRGLRALWLRRRPFGRSRGGRDRDAGDRDAGDRAAREPGQRLSAVPANQIIRVREGQGIVSAVKVAR